MVGARRCFGGSRRRSRNIARRSSRAWFGTPAATPPASAKPRWNRRSSARLPPARKFAEEETLDPTELPEVVNRRQLVSYPLVGNITPWNFPCSMAFLDTIPALIAGCAVVVKPSEVAPRFIDVVERILQDVPELAQVLAFARGDERGGRKLHRLGPVVHVAGTFLRGGAHLRGVCPGCRCLRPAGRDQLPRYPQRLHRPLHPGETGGHGPRAYSGRAEQGRQTPYGRRNRGPWRQVVPADGADGRRSFHAGHARGEFRPAVADHALRHGGRGDWSRQR